MKIKILMDFNDKESGKLVKKDTVLDVSKERATLLIARHIAVAEKEEKVEKPEVKEKPKAIKKKSKKK